MMKIKAVLAPLCFLLLAITCSGQQTATNQKPILSATALSKTIGFLRVEFTKDGRLWNTYGTAFFVCLEDKRLGENKGFTYLVTNRHVAEPQENGTKYPTRGTFLRLNFQQDQQGMESDERPMPISGSGFFHWYFPTDESVDLAVIPFDIGLDLVDYAAFPTSLFATRDVIEQQHFAAGDWVLYTEYFPNSPDMRRIAIFQGGYLAMPMETTLPKSGNVYLAYIHILEGNSGGPLFVEARNGMLVRRLIGVISGFRFFTEEENFKLTIGATTLGGKPLGNWGIAKVVPVDELKQILESPELQMRRNAIVSQQPK